MAEMAEVVIDANVLVGLLDDHDRRAKGRS
jgi:hypothetical protein